MRRLAAVLLVGLGCSYARGQVIDDRPEGIKAVIARIDRMVTKSRIPEQWWRASCASDDDNFSSIKVDMDAGPRDRIAWGNGVRGDCDAAKAMAYKCRKTLEAAGVFDKPARGQFEVISVNSEDAGYSLNVKAQGRRANGSGGFLSSGDRVGLARLQKDVEWAEYHNDPKNLERAKIGERTILDMARERLASFERVDLVISATREAVKAYGVERLAKANKVEAVIYIRRVKISPPARDPAMDPVVGAIYGEL